MAQAQAVPRAAAPGRPMWPNSGTRATGRTAGAVAEPGGWKSFVSCRNSRFPPSRGPIFSIWRDRQACTAGGLVADIAPLGRPLAAGRFFTSTCCR